MDETLNPARRQNPPGQSIRILRFSKKPLIIRRIKMTEKTSEVARTSVKLIGNFLDEPITVTNQEEKEKGSKDKATVKMQRNSSLYTDPYHIYFPWEGPYFLMVTDSKGNGVVKLQEQHQQIFFWDLSEENPQPQKIYPAAIGAENVMHILKVSDKYVVHLVK
jgi:hypothetical protein